MIDSLWSVAIFLMQALIASGGSILILSLPKVGDKILSHHLERRLAQLKHDHDQAIEGLRAQLAHLGDRGKHSNEKEFQALEAVWNEFVEAYLATNTCVISMMEFPDLNKLDQDEVVSFLDSTDFSAPQKQQVLAANDKNKMYSRLVTLRQLNAARLEIFKVRSMLRKNGIFIPAALQAQFRSAIEVLSRAEVERYVEFRHESFHEYKDSSFLLQNGEKIISDLGDSVRARLLRD
jgi:hypothetical protein